MAPALTTMQSFSDWLPLLGRCHDDAALIAALAAVGIRKIPRLAWREGDINVMIELKGLGLEIDFRPPDEDLPEELVLYGLLAKLDRSQGRDLYTGELPLGLSAGLSQTEVRRRLGKPTEELPRDRLDIWQRKKDRREVGVTYAKDGKGLAVFGMSLLPA